MAMSNTATLVVLLSMVSSMAAMTIADLAQGPLTGFIGGCPVRKAESRIGKEEASKLNGKWYKYSISLPSSIVDAVCPCSYVKISNSENEEYLNFENHFSIFPYLDIEYTLIGTLEQEDRDYAKFNYTFNPLYVSDKFSVDVQIIETDGKNFILASFCKEVPSFFSHLETFVVLTKNKEVSASVQGQIENAIKKSLDSIKFSKVSQSNC